MSAPAQPDLSGAAAIPRGAAPIEPGCPGGGLTAAAGAAACDGDGEDGAGLRRAARLATLAGAALLLTWPALWNGYPLVFADTGTYLGQALLVYAGWDRPPFYSLFLLATHWRLTLWLPVLAQGLILAHLIGLVLRVQGLPGALPLLLVAALLGAVTGLPFFAAQLMPDVFTGVLVLALWLLGFRAARLVPAEVLWLMLLAALAVATHLSHLPLALGLAMLGTLLLWTAEGSARRMALPAARMLAPPLLAAGALLAVNAAAHHRLSVSPFGSVFLATRLIYDGPGRAHLDRACAADPAAYRLCPVLDRLPGWHNGFLWRPDSPLAQELGGAKAWAPEAARIVRGTLRDSPGPVAAAVLGNTAAQLGMMRTGDGLEAWPGEPGPEPLIAHFFPQDLTRFLESRQQRGLLKPAVEGGLAWLHVLAAWAGLAAVAALLGAAAAASRRGGRPAGGPAGRANAALALFVLAAAVGNAAVTGGLSGPAHRYQARLAWLFVFAPVAIAAGMTRGAAPAPLSRSADRARAAGGAAPAA